MLLIGHGAEAKIYLQEVDGVKTVIKERLPKTYRHPELDRRINETRIRAEAKIIEDLSKKGMKVPKLIRVEREQHRILMSYVEGEKMKDYLNRPDLAKEQVEAALKSMGNLVKEVHARGVIHGDLTTSNMIMQNGKDIFLIDFGLSYIKSTVEDRAVDLYVLERAFKSTHPQLEAQFDIILLQYEDIAVVQRLDVVKQRGRKKIAFG